MKKKFIVREESWVLGRLEPKGATVLATDEEVKYLLPTGVIEAAPEETTPSPTTRTAKPKADEQPGD